MSFKWDNNVPVDVLVSSSSVPSSLFFGLLSDNRWMEKGGPNASTCS